MDDFNLIKMELISILKSVIDMNVFFEEVVQTKGQPAIKEYWFISMIPITISNAGYNLQEIAYLVGITCNLEQPTNHKLMVIYNMLNKAVLPCIHFGEHFVTIDNVDFNIVDTLAHYNFKLVYIAQKTESTGSPVEKLEVIY